MTVGSANRVARVKQRVEALTDDLAAKPYESLEPGELDELMATLEPLASACYSPPRTGRRSSDGVVGRLGRRAAMGKFLHPAS